MSIAHRLRVEDVTLLSNDWYVLKKTTFSFQRTDGSWQRQSRETYDRGNGATILLYDPVRRRVILTRQFRYPAFVNGHPGGMLIETAGDKVPPYGSTRKTWPVVPDLVNA